MTGLCYRCEHRAKFHEDGSQPRFECGQIKQSVFRCYMFQPVKPIVLIPDKDDPRKAITGYFAPRSEGRKTDDVELTSKIKEDGWLLYWKPKTEVENE